MPLTDSLLIFGILSLNVAISEWLCRHTPLRHFGTALLVIIVTAIIANLGLIPSTSTGVPAYDWLTGDVVMLAVFWLLLQVNLRELLKAGGPMISMFLIGSMGTFLGVLTGMWMIGGESIGRHYAGFAAMFTGTYTGGSVNFNAMAVQYGVTKDGPIYIGSVVVDNIMTAVWMVVTIAVPRGIGFLRRRGGPQEESHDQTVVLTGIEEDTEVLHPLDLGIVIALGVGGIGLSRWLSGLAGKYEWDIPAMLILTVLALVLAQFKFISRLRGARTLGMFSVYLFLAVIGALCDFKALGATTSLGGTIFKFALVLIAVHGLFIFSLGAIFRVDRDIVAIASQANIGGGTSALALARSLGRAELVLPAILVGSLGIGLGNFLGMLMAKLLQTIHAMG